MSKIYRSKTGLVVASGTVKSISQDGRQLVVASGASVKHGDAYKYEPMDITVNLPLPAEGFTVGSPVAAAGWPAGENAVNAETCVCNESSYHQFTDKVAVVSGQVMFARYNDEIDKVTGEHRLTKAGTQKKPHFDISIAVGNGAERVLHTVRAYGDSTQSAQNRMANFDRTENPVYATIVTQPGESYTTTNERNGRTYHNTNMSHIGLNSLDIIFTKDLVKEGNREAAPAQEAPAAAAGQAAPAQTVAQEAPAPAPAQANNGFSLEGLDMSVVDGFEYE